MAATIAALVSTSDHIAAHPFSHVSIIPAGETALVPTIYRRRKTHSPTIVRIHPRPPISCSELRGCPSANSVSRLQGIAHPVPSGHRYSLPLTLHLHCISLEGRM